MTCNVVRVTHTGVTVSDIERTSAFFRDVLGFEVTEPMQHSGDYVSRLHGVENASVKIAFCSGGGHTIELIQYVNPEPQPALKRRHNETGFMHVAMMVEDIDAAAQALQAAGFELFSPPQVVQAGPRKGGKNVYARDLAGLVLELQQAPPR
jgi:catechol 2,3-dioxygenase-like lactoylglutathione lyase family enzyme